MTNQEALDLYQVAGTFRDQSGVPVKFAWALMRNMKRIETTVIEPLRELTKPSEALQEYEQKRRELCQETACKDATGEFILENGNYTFPDGKAPDMSALQETYQEELDKREQQLKDADRILAEDYDGELYQVAFEHLPETISPGALSILEPIIVDS